MDKVDYRAVMGERLKEFREERGYTLYKVAKKGNIQIGQVKAIESGEKNYTIDAFIGYIAGCDLYMCFAEKKEKGSTDFPHDFKDISEYPANK